MRKLEESSHHKGLTVEIECQEGEAVPATVLVRTVLAGAAEHLVTISDCAPPFNYRILTRVYSAPVREPNHMLFGQNCHLATSSLP